MLHPQAYRQASITVMLRHQRVSRARQRARNAIVTGTAAINICASGGSSPGDDSGANGCARGNDSDEIAILGESRARFDSPYDEAIHTMQEADDRSLPLGVALEWGRGGLNTTARAWTWIRSLTRRVLSTVLAQLSAD